MCLLDVLSLFAHFLICFVSNRVFVHAPTYTKSVVSLFPFCIMHYVIMCRDSGVKLSLRPKYVVYRQSKFEFETVRWIRNFGDTFFELHFTYQSYLRISAPVTRHLGFLFLHY